MVLYYFSLLLLFLVHQSAVDAASACKGYAKYKLTFEALWSSATHPNAYINSAHFSPIIGASHNDSYKMWGPGQLATNGIKVMAETGWANPLENEITKQINMGYAKQVIKGRGVSSPGKLTDIQVSVNHDYPLVSIVTMIAPSPDWFVGIYRENLCDENTGKFKNEASFDLGPWDSGTDNGTQFNSPNIATVPPVPIFLITNTMDTVFKSNAPISKLAVMTLTKTNESVMATATTIPEPSSAPVSACQGSAEYELIFEALWSKERQPNAYIKGAHFSSIIGASHNSKYKMWGPGLNATKGVKVVAETGNPNLLKAEITSQINTGNAYKVISGPGVNSPGVLSGIKVFVDNSYSMVSVITMIAPSPDWFVGVDGVNLCNTITGEFKANLSFDLGPWDSGTDDGKLFNSPNKVSDPPVPIFLITSDMDTVFKDKKIASMAKMTFKKMSKPSNKVTTIAPTSKSSVISGFSLQLYLFTLTLLLSSLMA